MKLTVRGKNMELTDALKIYVEKRIGKIDKYFDFDTDAQVTLNVERGLHKVEIGRASCRERV